MEKKGGRGMDIDKPGPVQAVSSDAIKLPIWLRKPSEITFESYIEHCKKFSPDTSYLAPFGYKHNSGVVEKKVTGNVRFNLLLHIPDLPPMNFTSTTERGMEWFKNGIFRAECENLMPEHTHFLKGIIDADIDGFSPDLKAVVEYNGIDLVREILRNETVAEKFYAQYGHKLEKAALEAGPESGPQWCQCLRFLSSISSGIRISVDSFTAHIEIARFPAHSQRFIYFVAGTSGGALDKSPLVKELHQKMYFVLYAVSENEKAILKKYSVWEGHYVVEARLERRLWGSIYKIKKRPVFSSWMTAEELAKEVEIGDLIEVSKTFYSHFAIVIEDLHMDLCVRVIELVIDHSQSIVDSLGVTNTLGRIEENDMIKSVGINVCRIANRKDGECIPKLKDDIVQYARSRITKGTYYNLALYNCEKFGQECRYGKRSSSSSQVETATAMGIGILLGVGAGCVAMML